MIPAVLGGIIAVVMLSAAAWMFGLNPVAGVQRRTAAYRARRRQRASGRSTHRW